jgi:ankyrin repeat protein
MLVRTSKELAVLVGIPWYVSRVQAMLIMLRLGQHHAAGNDRVEVLHYLIENGAAVESEATRGDKPLHCAAQFGMNLAVKALLDVGADIEAVNYPLNRPMNQAATYGRVETLKLLIERGADINVHGNSGVSQFLMHPSLIFNDHRCPLVKPNFANRTVDASAPRSRK